MATYGLVALPLGLPVLPRAPMSRYAAAFGAETTTNRGEPVALPQDYADMLGWPEQAAAVARAYAALPPADRARAAVLGGNYGGAGAVDEFRPSRRSAPVTVGRRRTAPPGPRHPRRTR